MHKRLILFAAGTILLTAAASADVPVTLEFSGAQIADMFVALGRATGRSIVPDETVRGTSSYFLTAVGANAALVELTERYGLFVDERDGIITVSALRVEVDASARLTVSGTRIPVRLLLERLSRATRTPVLHTDLPDVEVTYHVTAAPLSTVLEHLATHLPDHRLEVRNGAYVFARSDRSAHSSVDDRWITRVDDAYTVESDQAPLTRLLDILFRLAGREYQLLKHSNPSIGPLRYAARGFDDVLTLMLERADAAFAVVDGVYYITDAPAASARARAEVTQIVRLRHVSAGSMLELLPPEQIAGVTVRPDRASNTVTISGNPGSVERVARLIGRVDEKPAGYSHYRFEVRLPPATVLAVLPRHLSGLGVTPVPDASAVTVYASPEQAAELEAFLIAVDVPQESVLVELEHILVEQLLGNLPASAGRSNVIPTGDSRRFFYRGTTDARDRFLRDLESIDTPVPQIRYHLLVIKYQDGEGLEFDFDLSKATSTPVGAQVLVGSIGRLLSLDLDIISTFGYQFAARLSAGLSSSAASVIADTTLNALSGESVSFRNTSTYRYRDTIVDPKTGAQHPTGVVREITSGLILEIQGQVTGQTVTMDVGATVSRRGADVSGSGNPPPTSEKIVRTQVRTASGEPVILSGLRLREEERTVNEPPILGRIPAIGRLFQKRRDHTDATELAIYIVPRIDYGPAAVSDAASELMRIYTRYYGSAK